jgi:chromosome segregation ATPase
MSGENYSNYYVEILTSTMTDVIVRNISMQANARVSEEIINEQAKRIEELSENVSNNNTQNASEVTKLNDTIRQLNAELDELRRQRGEFESVKSQAQHVDTFRNELLKERDSHQNTRNDYEQKIKNLNDKIEYLQLTPAKRKKLDEAKQTKTVEVFSAEAPVETTDTIKDGGSF